MDCLRRLHVICPWAEISPAKMEKHDRLIAKAHWKAKRDVVFDVANAEEIFEKMRARRSDILPGEDLEVTTKKCKQDLAEDDFYTKSLRNKLRLCQESINALSKAIQVNTEFTSLFAEQGAACQEQLDNGCDEAAGVQKK